VRFEVVRCCCLFFFLSRRRRYELTSHPSSQQATGQQLFRWCFTASCFWRRDPARC
jgi:hypothetical protein